MRFRRRPEAEPDNEQDPQDPWARPAADIDDAPALPGVPEANGFSAPERPEEPDVPVEPQSPESHLSEVPEIAPPDFPGPDFPGPEVAEPPNPFEAMAAALEAAAPLPPLPPEPPEADTVAVAYSDEPPIPAGPAVELLGEDPPVWPPRPVAPVLPDPTSGHRSSWPVEAPPYIADGAVRAAGGVVWSGWGQQLRILLIHRPKYDDWSLPKGKADPGESDTACARREVREETGLSCSLGDELSSITYVDRHGRPKTVRYWAMQPLGGSFSPHAEVDQIRWLSVDEAGRLCSYERDAEVLAGFAATHEVPPS